MNDVNLLQKRNKVKIYFEKLFCLCFQLKIMLYFCSLY